MSLFFRQLLPTLLLSPLAVSAQVIYSQPGTLDQRFGVDGLDTLDAPINAMIVGTDDRIYTASAFTNPYTKPFIQCRDPQSHQVISTDSLDAPGYKINDMIWHDGNILVTLHDGDGMIDDSIANTIKLMNRRKEGGANTAFKETTLSFTGYPDNPGYLAHDAKTGHIAIANMAPNKELWLTVLTKQGERLPGFGTNGQVNLNADPQDMALDWLEALQFQKDGKLLVGGGKMDDFRNEGRVLRIDQAGKTDPGFHPALRHSPTIQSIETFDDGRIRLIAIEDRTPYSYAYQLRADGARDHTYGNQGSISLYPDEPVVVPHYGATYSYRSSMVLPGNGMVTAEILDRSKKTAILWTTADGVRDTSYGADGVVLQDNKDRAYFTKHVALQPQSERVLVNWATTAGDVIGCYHLKAKPIDTVETPDPGPHPGPGPDSTAVVEFSLFPNPTQDGEVTFTTGTPMANKAGKVLIFNMAAQRLYEQAIEHDAKGEAKLKLGNTLHANGVYIFHYQNGGGTTYTGLLERLAP